MNQAKSNQHNPDMLDEYDFSEGVRGKYAHAILRRQKSDSA